MSGHAEREAESRSASSCLIHRFFSPTDFKVLGNLEDPHHLRAAGIAMGLGSQHSPKKAVSFDILIVLSHLSFFFFCSYKVQRKRYQKEVQQLKL